MFIYKQRREPDLPHPTDSSTSRGHTQGTSSQSTTRTLSKSPVTEEERYNFRVRDPIEPFAESRMEVDDEKPRTQRKSCVMILQADFQCILDTENKGEGKQKDIGKILAGLDCNGANF